MNNIAAIFLSIISCTIYFIQKNISVSILNYMRKISQDLDINRILIGVAGGSASGKTTLCNNILKQMAFDSTFKVHIITLDAFYKSIDTTKVNVADQNFDHPNSLDFDQAYNVLLNLLKGKVTQIPKYSFVTYSRLPQVQIVKPTDVIIFEGILAFYDERIRNLMKYKIFMNCDDDIRLCRRLKRDVEQRGRTIENILYQYNRFVKDAYANYIFPTIRYADLIVPGFRTNKVSVDFIVQHLKNIAKQMSFYKRALTTLIYFYGDVLEYVILGDVQENEQKELNYLDEQNKDAQMIFPTTSEHKKELDLFMQHMLNEAFSVSYYKNVMINQYLRILCSLMRKIMQLKKYQRKDVEVLKIWRIQRFEKFEFNKQKKLKILFCTNITNQNAKIVGQIRKFIGQQYNLLILNIYCSHKKLGKLYKLENTTIVNLFCIANQRRFIQILNANMIQNDNKAFQIFQNDKLLKRCVNLIQQQVQKYGQDTDY